MMNSHLCTVDVVTTPCTRLLITVWNCCRALLNPITERHRAGSDGPATAEIFLHLLERLAENGVTDLLQHERFNCHQ